MDKTCLSVINSDPEKNIAILGFFNNYPVIDFVIEKNSIWILGESDHLWAHISSSSERELSAILAKNHDITSYYYSIEDWMIPLVLKHGSPDWIMTTDRYILGSEEPMEAPVTRAARIDASYAPYIYENSEYKKFTSVEYIEDRLSMDVSAGIWVNDILVAWGFTHDDGALGFLHVLGDHRNHGYGMEIMRSLVYLKKTYRKPVFCNIVPGNTIPIDLVNRLGFKFDRRVSWLKLK